MSQNINTSQGQLKLIYTSEHQLNLKCFFLYTFAFLFAKFRKLETFCRCFVHSSHIVLVQFLIWKCKHWFLSMWPNQFCQDIIKLNLLYIINNCNIDLFYVFCQTCLIEYWEWKNKQNTSLLFILQLRKHFNI